MKAKSTYLLLTAAILALLAVAAVPSQALFRLSVPDTQPAERSSRRGASPTVVGKALITAGGEPSINQKPKSSCGDQA